MRKQQREAILALLEETYMGTETALNYSTPFELLVAVIMSAQCTDERVNKITARIFPKYNTPEKMGALSQEQLEEEIRDCGLFRSKAKNLLATCKMLTEEYNSVIPDTVEELMVKKRLMLSPVLFIRFRRLRLIPMFSEFRTGWV